MRCKHGKRESILTGKNMLILLSLLIITVIGVLVYSKLSSTNKDKEIKNNLEQNNQIQDKNEEIELSELEIVNVDMPEKIENYDVLGEIEIQSIGVKKYILSRTTDESLDLSVTRFWGEGIHESGNFSIIGHNYSGIFKDLKELVLGDTFTLTSKDGRICTYVIYDIFIVEPNDVSCIEDSLNGEREVTLITCTPGGERRLILKAKEQK